MLIAAHGNSLRALVKYLDGMSDEDVVGLNIPTGIPLRYDLDGDLRPTVAGGTLPGSRGGGGGRRGGRGPGREVDRANGRCTAGKHWVNGEPNTCVLTV